MAKLEIESWNRNNQWASEGAWPQKAFCNRMAGCTNLRSTELKRIAKGVMRQEILEINNIVVEKSEPLIHMLESLGAKVSIK